MRDTGQKEETQSGVNDNVALIMFGKKIGTFPDYFYIQTTCVEFRKEKSFL